MILFGIERQNAVDNIEELLKFNSLSKKSKFINQNSLFSYQPKLTSLKLEPTEIADSKTRLAWEKELLGLYISDHPLKKHLAKLKDNRVQSIKEAINSGHKDRTRLKTAGIIASIQKFITKMGKPMLFVKIEDLTDNLEVIVFFRNPCQVS